MKIFLICEDDKHRTWLNSCLDFVPFVDSIVLHARGFELTLEETQFISALIVVTQDQFPALRRQLSKQYSAKELPCPILVLSESFDSFDVSGYRDATLEAFPRHAITPDILQYLLNTLRRDFRKDLRLKRLAHYDALTGACNRYLFSDRVKQAISSAKRQQESLSFLYFDLDKFKQINDQYGHAMGDEYLKTFVNVLVDNIRDMDTLGRLGGDEFGLLLPKLNQMHAVNTAERMVKALQRTHKIGEHELKIEVSIGIASFLGNEEPSVLNYKNLVSFADIAMMDAKLNSHSNIAVFKNSGKSSTTKVVA